MAAELRGGLSFCLSGGSFWSHDIGGFYGKATPDLYKRWVAFGLLSSHSRLHGDDSYRVPWNFDEEAVTVLRHFTRLRHTLLPYMYSYCCAAHETGLPLMRPMLLEFPRDLTCRFLDRQYLLGAEILVAPVLNPDGHVDFYLPAGEWTDFFTGEVVEGGKWATASFDYFSLPLFIRENSIIPTGSVEDAPSRSSFDSLLLTVYRLKTTGSFTVQDGTRTVRVKVGRSGEELFLSLSEPIEGLRVVFKDVPQPKEVKGAASLDSEASVVLVSGTHCSVR
jgi:alpha-D-xyloside xylohydrolase